MESLSACPKCGASRLPEALDCPTCGIVYSKYKGPQMTAAPATEPVTRREPERPAHAEPPPEAPEGVWRKGRTLVVARLAELPDRCVSCNEPAEARLTRQLTWHKPWVYVFLLVNLIVYALVALVVRQKASIEVPQCARHAKLRRYGWLGAWAFMGVATLLAFWSAAASAHSDGGTALPVVIFFGAAFVALVVGFTIGRPVVAQRIDDEFLWLGKCGKSYLESLPEAPQGI